MRRRALAAVASGLVLLLAGCGLLSTPEPTPSADVRGIETELRPFYGQRIAWRDCADGFRCATAEAPLDWAEPGDGKPIELALTKRPASGDRIGTLFTNPGGPGVAAVDFLQRAAEQAFDRSLLERYDIVAWDPRGVGESSAVDCYGTKGLDAFLFDDPDLPEGSAALADRVESASTAFGDVCERHTGELLAHVGTADTVQDLDMLRAALGERRLDYLGFSYGTSIGAQYADRYPKRVGRMVLDGAVDPSITDFERTLANTEAFGAALRTYLADCVRSSGCPFRGATVDQAIDLIATVLVRLRESPIRASGVRAVNSVVLRTAINAALYDQRSWQYLSQAFAEILQGETRTTQALADSYVQRGEDGYTGNLFEAIYAVNCLDRPVATDPTVLQRQGERLDAADPLRAASNTEELGNPVCGNWPVPPQAEPAPVQAVGAPPIVVIGTTGDPATPYEWAQGLAGQLPGAVLLTLEGEGHLAYGKGSACIDDPVDRFLVEGVLPKVAVCR